MPRKPRAPIPTALTLGSVMCSGFALVAIAKPTPDVAVATQWVVLAGVFDMLDGPVARLLGQQTKMGAWLDALADMLAFVVVPAFLAWRLGTPGPLLAFAVACWVLSGGYRLLRHLFSPAAQNRTCAQGLATTMAGGTLAAALAAHSIPPIWMPIILVVGATLMASHVPYRHFREFGHVPRVIAGVVIAIGVVAAGPGGAAPLLAVLGVLYACVGLIEGTILVVRQLLDDEEDEDESSGETTSWRNLPS